MSDKIPPEIELHIELKRKEDHKEYDSLFSQKWVERAFIWAIYLIGGIILTAVVVSASKFIN